MGIQYETDETYRQRTEEGGNMGLRIDIEMERQETEKKLKKLRKAHLGYLSEEEIAEEYGFPGK